MKKLLPILLLGSVILCLSVSKVNAQFISGTLNINPYPSPYTSDWETNPSALGSLVVTFNGDRLNYTVFLDVKIFKTGKDEVFHSVSNSLVLNQAMTVVDNTKLVKFRGADYPDKDFKNKIEQSGRIPEGQYTVCVNINNADGITVSGNNCANFTIVYPEPPQLISPANGDLITQNTYPVFQWTPIFAHPSYQALYSLKVVELLPGQLPSKALSANVPQFQQSNITSSNLVYPIDALPMKDGETYAWQVQVLDQNGFPPTQNQGRSQIFTFTYRKPMVTIRLPRLGPKLSKPANNSTIKSNRPEFSWKYAPYKNETAFLKLVVVPVAPRQPTSKAFQTQTPVYQKQLDINRTEDSPTLPVKFISGDKYAWEIQVTDSKTGKILRTSNMQAFIYKPEPQYTFHPSFMQSSSVSGTLMYEFAKPGEYTVWPLKNRKLKLVMAYVLKTKEFSGNAFPEAYKGHPASIVIPGNQLNPVQYPESGKILGTGSSDGSGHFSISFFNSRKMGLVKKNYRIGGGGGEFSYSISGDLYRVARLVVEDSHYTSPSKDIIVQPMESQNAGQMVAYVRSYQLTVTVKSPENHVQYIGGGTNLAGMTVYIMRLKSWAKKYYHQIPDNEGSPINRNPGDPLKTMIPRWPREEMEIVAKKITNNKGQAVFNRLVKCSSWNEYYWIFTRNDTTKGALNYVGSVMSKFKYPNDHAVYSDEYKYVNTNQTIHTSPIYPRIAGHIKYQGSKLPGLGGVKVQLYNASTGKFERQMLSQWYPDMGFFVFNELPVLLKGNEVTYQHRTLIIQKQGFHIRAIPIPKLKPGQQWVNDIFLKPNSLITGKVVNEEGNGVSAQVSVLFGASVKAIAPMIIDFKTHKRLPAKFKVPAPQGKVILIVDPTPFDPSYFKETVPINLTSGLKDTTIVLKRKEKRLRIIVRGKNKSGTIIPIASAKVKVETPSGKSIGQLTSNSQGVADLVFTNADENFVITASAPSGKFYETGQISAKVKDSKDWTDVTVNLKQASFLSGKITVGKQNQPVANAVIRVVNSSGITIQDTTAQDGTFQLNNVPIGSHLYKASKSQSNYVGAQKTLNVPGNGLKGVNFNLSVFADMDISKLMGFPISVDKLTQSGGQVKISGSFEKLDSLGNNIFTVNKQEDLTFQDLAIVPGTQTSKIFGKDVPVAKPADLPLKTDNNTLNLALYKVFNGQIRDKKIGIELADDGSGLGVIMGKVWIGKSSFSVPQTNINSMDEHGFFLKIPNSSSMKVPVILASGKDPGAVSSGYQVADSSGGPLHFTFFNYKADADPSQSFIRGDSLSLHTHIHTALQNITPSDLNLDIGQIVLRPSDKTIKPINGSEKLSVKLDNWVLETSNWTFSGYLNVTKGILNTNLVDIPVTNLQITPTSLLNEKFDFKSLSLGGIVPLKVDGDPVLGYDATKSSGPEWFLSVSNVASHVASFGGLPGMAKGDSVFIESFSLYSKSDPTFTPSFNQKTLRIHKVGILKPNTISYYPDPGFVEITGLSYDIPDLSLDGAIHYTKENNQIRLKVLPLQFALHSQGIVATFGMNAMESATQMLDARGFRAKGTLSEMQNGVPLFQPKPLVVWLYHTTDSTSIIVEKPPIRNTWQTLNIGGANTYLDKVEGRMAVKSDSWDYFRFAGDLTGTKGVKQDQNRMAFTVKGEIEADEQHLGIKNVNTPFGNMSWTYEFKNKRLIGTLDIHKDLGGMALDGQAESLVDSRGWYFIAGGTLKIPGIGPANAAMLFGDYPVMTSSVREKFAASSYNKNLPASFEKNISGFLFSGALQIPVLIPNIDVNMGIASVGFGVDAGGDIRAWKGFNEGGSEFGIGALAFIHAYLYMNAITCTSLDADATVELGFTGTYQSSSSTFNLDGCGSFKLTGSLTQQGVGIGDLCTPPAITFSKSYAFKALMHLDSSGNTSLGFGQGTCSGN